LTSHLRLRRLGRSGRAWTLPAFGLHNINIDRTLNRLGTYIDPRKRAALLKFLIEEEEQLGAGSDQLETFCAPRA
jgi:hypothetical protein